MSQTTMRCLPLLAFLIMVSGFSLYTPLMAAAQHSETLSEQEMIERIDAAVRARTEGVEGYTVKELYSIYRNGDTTPAAQVKVRTIYTRGVGKEYTPVEQTGSALLRSVIVDHILANEKEMAKAANRETVSVTSANYEMRVEPGHVTINGRDCVVVDLKARRKTPYLFNGKAWFDLTDFTLVHLEGTPAQSLSIFAGETHGRRDYVKISGFSMAQHAEVRAHSFLFGDTIVKIDYTDYQLDLSSLKPANSSP